MTPGIMISATRYMTTTGTAVISTGPTDRRRLTGRGRPKTWARGRRHRSTFHLTDPRLSPCPQIDRARSGQADQAAGPEARAACEGRDDRAVLMRNGVVTELSRSNLRIWTRFGQTGAPSNRSPAHCCGLMVALPRQTRGAQRVRTCGASRPGPQPDYRKPPDQGAVTSASGRSYSDIQHAGGDFSRSHLGPWTSPPPVDRCSGILTQHCFYRFCRKAASAHCDNPGCATHPAIYRRSRSH
jgi:hypothetical protein